MPLVVLLVVLVVEAMRFLPADFCLPLSNETVTALLLLMEYREDDALLVLSYFVRSASVLEHDLRVRINRRLIDESR